MEFEKSLKNNVPIVYVYANGQLVTHYHNYMAYYSQQPCCNIFTIQRYARVTYAMVLCLCVSVGELVTDSGDTNFGRLDCIWLQLWLVGLGFRVGMLIPGYFESRDPNRKSRDPTGTRTVSYTHLTLPTNREV